MACGEGHDVDSRDCDAGGSLDDWCGRVWCGTRTIDDALPQLPGYSDAGTPSGTGLAYSSLGFLPCDRLLVVNGSYYYDEASGALVGASWQSDLVDASCPERIRVGRQPSGQCDVCGLVNHRARACVDEISAPLRQQCIDDPPGRIATCVECACNHCYPYAICSRAKVTDFSRVFANAFCDNALRDCVRRHECRCEYEDL